jgi:integrase
MLERPLTLDDLVFTNVDGNPVDPSVLSHAFGKIARQAGLNGVRFHDLRHAHASLMLQQGVSVKVISERLGHSGVAITLDTYSHVLPGMQEAAIKRFDEVMEATKVEKPKARVS